MTGYFYYCDRASVHAVAAEYLHSTLKGTPSCSSHSGTALCETYVAAWRDLDEYAKEVGALAQWIYFILHPGYGKQ